jgi:hypothetical protein
MAPHVLLGLTSYTRKHSIGGPPSDTGMSHQMLLVHPYFRYFLSGLSLFKGWLPFVSNASRVCLGRIYGYILKFDLILVFFFFLLL